MIPRRLAEAYYMSALSPDDSNQNGAVVYSDNSLMSTGYNHFPPGVPPTQQRPEKYERIVHAEAAACLRLSECSIMVDSDTTMYAPWATCKACAVAILCSKIPKLVIHYDRCLAYMETRKNEGDLKNWQPAIDESAQWLKDGGCDIEVYRGPVPFDGTILINSRPWSPKELCFAD